MTIESPPRVLVLGATGFVGRALASAGARAGRGAPGVRNTTESTPEPRAVSGPIYKPGMSATRKVSDIFARWIAIPGFEFTDITYHRARDLGCVRIAFDRQIVAGEATRLGYMTDEAREGRDAFLEKRPQDFSTFPWHY